MASKLKNEFNLFIVPGEPESIRAFEILSIVPNATTVVTPCTKSMAKMYTFPFVKFHGRPIFGLHAIQAFAENHSR